MIYIYISLVISVCDSWQLNDRATGAVQPGTEAADATVGKVETSCVWTLLVS